MKTNIFNQEDSLAEDKLKKYNDKEDVNMRHKMIDIILKVKDKLGYRKDQKEEKIFSIVNEVFTEFQKELGIWSITEFEIEHIYTALKDFMFEGTNIELSLLEKLTRLQSEMLDEIATQERVRIESTRG